MFNNKKISMSLVTASLLSTVAIADDMMTYTPESNDIQESHDLREIKEIKSKLSDLKQEIVDLKSLLNSSHSKTKVSAKAVKLKFSGKHYLGYTQTDPSKGDSTSKFETRRNYFQIKAYLKEDPKSYMRFTYDTHQSGDGEWNVRLKYAYLYLDNVFANTGVEIGQAHRPWIDYEEHHIWHTRSIHKVFVESSSGAHLTNSADLGVNFKTKTPIFTSEVGLFNGEGYHTKEDGRGQSLEWRLTYHPLGTGKKHVKPTKDTYLDISFFGQLNQSLAKSYDSEGKHENDLNWFAGAVVYNTPKFLVAGQYVFADNEDYKYQGNGFSLNGTFRLGNKYQYSVIGRYDIWDADDKDVKFVDKNGDKEALVVGGAYQYNKNVKFLANYTDVSYDDKSSKDYSQIMLTAEVNW
jgi:hypothetical protein